MPSGATGGDALRIEYSAARFCEDGTDPIAGITGEAGGTFSSTSGLVFISTSTGQVDLSATTPGSYIVTYTAPSSAVATTSISIDSIPVVSAGADVAICNGENTVLTATGATTYLWSTGETTASVTVDPTTNTIFTVTGYNGACSATDSVDVTVNAVDSAAFSYAASVYCANGTDPTPTITGTSGGAFTSTTGLVINSGTGAIDLDASTVGAYLITYTTTGVCPANQSVNLTINAADNAAFSYSASSFEPTDADPTPTITGLTGGTFSGTTGLVINSTTGEIDLSASTEASHIVTYNTSTSGSSVCPNTSTFGVTIAVAGISNVYSMNFDGINDYIDVSTIGSTLQTLNNGTLSFWIKPTTISGTQTVLGYGNTTTTADFFSVSTLTGGKLRLLFRNDSSGTAWPTNGVDLRSNASVITTNNWYHICVISDGSSYTVYLNGSAISMNVDAGSNSGKWFGDISGVTMNKTFIGAKESSSSIGNYFDGSIDEVGIWNTALTAPQVAQIYNATSTGKTADLSTISGSNLKYWNRLGD